MSVSFGASFQLKAGADPPRPPTVVYPDRATLLDDVEWALRNGVDEKGQPRMWTYNELGEFIESMGGFKGAKTPHSKWAVQMGRRLTADAAKPGGFRQHKVDRSTWLYWQHAPGELPQTFSRAPRQPRRVRFDEPAFDEPEMTYEERANARFESELDDMHAQWKAEELQKEARLLQQVLQERSDSSRIGKPGGRPAWNSDYERQYGMFLINSNPDGYMPLQIQSLSYYPDEAT